MARPLLCSVPAPGEHTEQRMSRLEMPFLFEQTGRLTCLRRPPKLKEAGDEGHRTIEENDKLMTTAELGWHGLLAGSGAAKRSQRMPKSGTDKDQGAWNFTKGPGAGSQYQPWKPGSVCTGVLNGFLSLAQCAFTLKPRHKTQSTRASRQACTNSNSECSHNGVPINGVRSSWQGWLPRELHKPGHRAHRTPALCPNAAPLPRKG